MRFREFGGKEMRMSRSRVLLVELIVLCFLASALGVSALAGEEYQISATIESPRAQYPPDDYGCSVAVSGDIVVLGEYSEEVEGNSKAGKVQIFDLDGNLKVTIQSPTPHLGSGRFGLSVAIRGDIILVGEPGATIDAKTWAGVVYIYNSDGSLQATIQSPTPTKDTGFGWKLCFSGDTIVVEDAYAYVEDMHRAGKVQMYDSDGNFLETLQSPEPSAESRFGHPVDGTEGIFVTGEGYAQVGDTAQAGKAYIFDSDGNLLATLQSPEPQFNALFGRSVAVSGNIVVVGEYWAEVEDNSRAGRAHIFDTDGNLLASLQSPEPEASANFGWSVDTNGDLILVGEPYANGESIDEGRVHVFDPEGNLLETLSAPEPTTGTEFGTLVLVEGEIIVVGEPGVSNVGRVYIFQPGAAAFTSNGLNIDPNPVNKGKTVTVSVECGNTGTASGEYPVVLTINGVAEDEKTVTIGPDETTSVSFEVTAGEAGEYSVDVNGLTGSYTVKGIIPGFPLESIVISIVLVVIGLWLIQRQR